MAIYRRISRIVAIALFALSLVFLSMAAPRSSQGDPALQWSVRMKDRELRVLSVEGKVFGQTARKFTFFAVEKEDGTWIEPIGIKAFGPGGLEIGIREDEGSWEIDAGGKDFSVVYDVVLTIEDRYSPEVRGMLSRLGTERSRIMGRDVFLQPACAVEGGVVVDLEFGGVSVIESPWNNTGTRMIVPDADELPMTFFVVGDWRIIRDSVSSLDLVLAIGGTWSFEDAELFRTVKDIVFEEIAIMGGSPREKHLVICDHNPVRGGKGFKYYGVHFGGTILLLLDPAIDRSELYGPPMSIISHEFFHNWNGETLHPADDSFLWFTEGATVYLSYMVLLETGIINASQYEYAESLIESRFAENPLRGSVRLDGAGNSDLSDRDMVSLLYDGGFLAARAIDSRIAAGTEGRAGLIDIIKRMYADNPGGAEIGMPYLLSMILSETGLDLSGFIEELLSGPPFPAISDVSS